MKIAALALQAISNISDCRQVAQVSKLIARESFPGKFGYVAKKDLDLDKSLFLLDMLEIGKRKYTQLRQHLLLSCLIRLLVTTYYVLYLLRYFLYCCRVYEVFSETWRYRYKSLTKDFSLINPEQVSDESFNQFYSSLL